MTGSPTLNLCSAILDTIELWMVEAGCPFTPEQAAELARARDQLALQQSQVAAS